VVLIRLYKRIPIWQADQRHFSHRLCALSMSRRATVLFIYLVSLTLGLAAPLLTSATPQQAIFLFLQVLCVLSIIALLEYFGEKKLEGHPR